MVVVRAPTYRVDKNPDMDAGLGNCPVFIVGCGYQTLTYTRPLMASALFCLGLIIHGETAFFARRGTK